jgi:hypothetical protein
MANSRGCVACGKDTGDSKFCPFCGTRVPDTATPIPEPVLRPAAPAPVPAPLPRGTSPVPGKSRTGLLVALIVIAVLVIAGAVVAVVLLTGSSPSLTIKSPKNGSTVEGGTVKVAVSASGGVSAVAVTLDGAKKKTMNAAPFTAEINSVPDGIHELEVTAYNQAGQKVGTAQSTFESKGAPKPPEGGDTDRQLKAYKEAVAPLVKDTSDANASIANLANRINTEVNFSTGYVPQSLKDDAQNIYAKILALSSKVSALSAPATMGDIQSRLKSLVEYLRVRTDALMKGLAYVQTGTDYKSQFDVGGTAKANFDKAWPAFLSACRAQGIAI